MLIPQSMSLIMPANINNNNYSNCPPASLIKQLAAMIYDSLLIIAILFISTAIALIFNDGNAIESSPVFSLYLILIIFIFYSWFWRKSGQTLGMRVWKIRIVSELGGNPSWSICFLRLTFALLSIACLGLGYWWRLVKPYTWHDRLSQTSIISVSAIPKEQQ
jgi:uncharacterized RDD family membrane protein YckC